MKSKMLMLASVAGILASSPAVDALAERHGDFRGGPGGPAFVIDRPPTFIQLATPGFSVSFGAPYDIVLYGNFYYLFDHGQWYRSPRYNGPWRFVGVRELPPRLRGYRIDQIRRMRDDEYNRHRDRYDHGRRDDRRDDRRDERRPDRWDGPGRHDDGRPMPPR